MSRFFKIIFFFVVVFSFTNCKKENTVSSVKIPKNGITYAKGFSIINYDGYSIVKVSNPWPKLIKHILTFLKKKTESFQTA
jgi:iron complex transport system substrate-binding protein